MRYLSLFRQLTLLVFAPLFSCLLSSATFASSRFDVPRPCKLVFQTGVAQRQDPDLVFVNGTKITGARQYPLELVLSNLNLDEEKIANFRSKQGALIGEGFSPLLGFLLGAGLTRIKAVDLWYEEQSFPDNADGRSMIDFINRHHRHLVSGNVFALPFAEASIDFVWSHLLVNNIAPKNKATQEMLRVLKPGGEARIYGYSNNAESRRIFSELETAGHQVEVFSKPITLHTDGRPNHITLHLLHLRKYSDTSSRN